MLGLYLILGFIFVSKYPYGEKALITNKLKLVHKMDLCKLSAMISYDLICLISTYFKFLCLKN